MEQWAQTVIGAVASLGTATVIGAVIYIRGLRKQLHELEKKCEHYATKESLNSVELKLKDLEKKDDLQQQTLDQLNNLFPVLNAAVKALSKGRR